MPVLGLFAPSHIPYDIDRDPVTTPSLPEMTTKALELLSKDNKNGFVLMIEGSRIDMAAHAHDIGTMPRIELVFGSRLFH